MTLSNHYAAMHILASQYAGRPDIVQGAGGNMSVKIGKERMLIKASGRTFKEIKPDGRGLVSVNHERLRRYLSAPTSRRATESDHLNIVRSYTERRAKSERPSMEVWFHTLLPQFVLHTHSAYVNIFGCSKEGPAMFKKIMRDNEIYFHSFSYCNPGFELGALMAKRLQKLKKAPTVVFLENHGVIVASESAEDCIALHDSIEKHIRKALRIQKRFALSPLNEKENSDFKKYVLFPDQIIYPEHRAIRAAHRCIVLHIRRAGLTIKTLPNKDIGVVMSMEAEKHRKGLQKTL